MKTESPARTQKRVNRSLKLKTVNVGLVSIRKGTTKPVSSNAKLEKKHSKKEIVRPTSATPLGSKKAKSGMVVRRKSAKSKSKAVVLSESCTIKRLKMENRCKQESVKSVKGKLSAKNLAACDQLRKAENNDTKQPTRKMYSANFEGLSDSNGSIDSAALDEDICYQCGKTTTAEIKWDNLILCDRCDGEYHLECVQLDKLPRNRWICPHCKDEIKQFEKLKYDVRGDFKIPRKKRCTPEATICYSPGRPLDVAWEECQLKGFMVVSRLLSHDVMRKLTHGDVTNITISGRVADHWKGAINEMEKRMKDSCRNLIVRDGRYDLKLPDFVVKSLDLESILKPVTERLRKIMGMPAPEIRTHNIVFVPVGSSAQSWHCDDSMRPTKNYRYFTILVHLNTIDSSSGGTEIWCPKLKVGDLVRGRPGDGFVFNGALQHRGQANHGGMHRFFYYASYACRADANAEYA